jgi:enamine deaminase RidA (YjgF/YER057c/UK114 family)
MLAPFAPPGLRYNGDRVRLLVQRPQLGNMDAMGFRFAGCLGIMWASVMNVMAGDIQYIQPSGGQSQCVVIDAAELVHTSQICGVTDKASSASQQASTALQRVEQVLAKQGSGLQKAVRLHFYLARGEDVAAVEDVLRQQYAGMQPPAVSIVQTTLPWAEALIAVDAIGYREQSAASETHAPIDVSATQAKLPWLVGAAAASRVLTVGPKVYVSGQAEKGDASMRDATKQTMLSLGRTLTFLGLSSRDVVHVKCFLGPMSQGGEALDAIQSYFGDSGVPPTSLVEWQSNLPIEIELVVSGNSNPALLAGPAIEVRTPPGMTAPPVYSRVTIARHSKTIYTSGIYAENPTAMPEAQMRSLFSQLKRTLDSAESDWMHLAKATYYVNNDELNKWHNLLRPDYFSPRRPPAASKATVRGVGRIGHGFMMDFIATPGE